MESGQIISSWKLIGHVDRNTILNLYIILSSHGWCTDHSTN
jgi:hypothetical protein